MWVNPAPPMKVDPESYITLCSVQGEPLPPGENSRTICRWCNVDWGQPHAQPWLQSPFSSMHILCNAILIFYLAILFFFFEKCRNAATFSNFGRFNCKLFTELKESRHGKTERKVREGKYAFKPLFVTHVVWRKCNFHVLLPSVLGNATCAHSKHALVLFTLSLVFLSL